MSEQISIWVNGRFAPTDAPAIRGDDRGFTLGEGVFETLLASAGRLWMPERHHARLLGACARLGLDPPALDLCQAVSAELLERNHLGTSRARVRWTLSGGAPEGGPTLVVSAVAAADPPASVALWQVPFTRNERGALAGIKSTAYAENLLAQAEARRHGADEALLLNSCGELCECATRNLFLVRGGTVHTPELKSGCLPGVTRAVVLALCAEANIPAHQDTLVPADLESAEEVFLTSSIGGILPVRSLQERVLGAAPGPVTARLAQLLEAGR
jgi:branched-chain amino acid aminotransferase